MAQIEHLLGVDFDGNPVPKVADVIYAGLADPRHRDRIPGLTRLMDDPLAPELDRLHACVALTTWGEPAGYRAVIAAAADPTKTPWYERMIDRFYSVDNTFARLAIAVHGSADSSREKGTGELRTQALRALVGIADTEYFDRRLEYALDEDSVRAIIDDIKRVIRRGLRALADHQPARFNVATQLMDLAAAVATVDTTAGVELGMEILGIASHPQVLHHAVAIVYRAQEAQAREFADYLTSIGDAVTRQRVTEALSSRPRP